MWRRFSASGRLASRSPDGFGPLRFAPQSALHAARSGGKQDLGGEQDMTDIFQKGGVPMRALAITASSLILSAAAWAQAPAAPKPAPAKPAAAAKPGPFNPRDLSGKYHRESKFQTYSNVPGGANELQAFILGQAS